MEGFKLINKVEDFNKGLDDLKFTYEIEESEHTITFVLYDIVGTSGNQQAKELTIHSNDEVGTIVLYINFNLFTIGDKENGKCRSYVGFGKDSAIIK